MSEDSKTPILRLKEFIRWAKDNGLCKSENDFERQCSLAPKYITNNAHTGKGNIGTEMLARIIKAYPQLNLVWLCSGKDSMINENSPHNMDYKKAYDVAMKHIEVLNEMLKKRE